MVEQDESWFSRFVQPRLHGWAETGNPLRSYERTLAPGEPNKALACYGAVRQDTQERFLFFADGQPNTDNTIRMLERLLSVARQEAKQVLAIIWDRATWHKSKNLKQWIYLHNQAAKQSGDVRLLTCLLPVKSPWLNPMEAHWLHAKRQVVELDGDLGVNELKRRLCAYFQVD